MIKIIKCQSRIEIILEIKCFFLKLIKRKSSKQPFLLQLRFLFKHLIHKVVLLLSYFSLLVTLLINTTTGTANKQTPFSTKIIYTIQLKRCGYLSHPHARDTNLFLSPTHPSPLLPEQLLNSSTDTEPNHQQLREYCISNVLPQKRIPQIKLNEN